MIQITKEALEDKNQTIISQQILIGTLRERNNLLVREIEKARDEIERLNDLVHELKNDLFALTVISEKPKGE